MLPKQKMSDNAERIYYTVTGPDTVKLGGSSSTVSRQRAHYTSSPFLRMHQYPVNDALRAEMAMHRVATEQGRLLTHDQVGDPDAVLDEHYNMTEEEADRLCTFIQGQYAPSRPLDPDRQRCSDCNRVHNVTTLGQYDGFRCKRCFTRFERGVFLETIVPSERTMGPLRVTREEQEEMYYRCREPDSYVRDGFLVDDDDDDEATAPEIDAVLDHHHDPVTNYLEYKVRWSDTQATVWLPAHELYTRQDLLNEYYGRNSR